MILSAQAQAKTERDRGELTPSEERRVSQVTRDELDGALAGYRADAGAAGTRPGRTPGWSGARPKGRPTGWP